MAPHLARRKVCNKFLYSLPVDPASENPHLCDTDTSLAHREADAAMFHQ